jgi:outer membrane protein assembly factor BamD
VTGFSIALPFRAKACKTARVLSGNVVMIRQGTVLGRVGLLAIGAMLLTGCGSDISSLNPFDTKERYKMEVLPDIPADRLYNDGLTLIEKRDFTGANKKFSSLEKQYPYSDWSRKAVLMTTYASYEGKDYDDAIIAGRRYLQLYPASADAAYAQYLIAMSHYNQIPDTSRDQERAEKAAFAFGELVGRYPKSEYAEDSRFKIQVIRDQLAGREMEIGRFYLNRRNYTGAINRFRDVISRYQTTRHVEEALMRLTEAYFALGIVNEAQTAAAVLGHNFPDSQWYKDAYTLLKSRGLEPREEKSSWISRTFQGFVRTVGVSR